MFIFRKVLAQGQAQKWKSDSRQLSLATVSFYVGINDLFSELFSSSITADFGVSIARQLDS